MTKRQRRITRREFGTTLAAAGAFAAAPAILAAESIARGGVPLAVPDFRPGPSRRRGEAPAAAARAG